MGPISRNSVENTDHRVCVENIIKFYERQGFVEFRVKVIAPSAYEIVPIEAIAGAKLAYSKPTNDEN